MPAKHSLDFGPGFYLTTDDEQALRWAKIVSFRRQSGQPTITVYETVVSKWEQLKILTFQTPDRSWLRYVVQCRKHIIFDQSYDVIWGPVANDRTMDVINQYINGSFTEDIAIQLLLPMKLKDQVVMKTRKALEALRFVEVREWTE